MSVNAGLICAWALLISMLLEYALFNASYPSVLTCTSVVSVTGTFQP